MLFCNFGSFSYFLERANLETSYLVHTYRLRLTMICPIGYISKLPRNIRGKGVVCIVMWSFSILNLKSCLWNGWSYALQIGHICGQPEFEMSSPSLRVTIDPLWLSPNFGTYEARHFTFRAPIFASTSLLWSPYVIRQTIYIFMMWFVLLLLSFFSSPNLSRRRLDVCHTSTHGVSLVRI